jgi:hypothetical protein
MKPENYLVEDFDLLWEECGFGKHVSIIAYKRVNNIEFQLLPKNNKLEWLKLEEEMHSVEFIKIRKRNFDSFVNDYLVHKYTSKSRISQYLLHLIFRIILK